MKLVKRLILMCACLVVIGIGFCGWLFYTTGGARFALSTILHFIDSSATFSTIQGRLADGITAEHIVVSKAGIGLSMDKVAASWSPYDLVYGRIHIKTLNVRNLTITNERDNKKPVDLTWPRLTGLPLVLWMDIQDVAASRIIYIQKGERPVLLTSLKARATWINGQLKVRSLTIVTDKAMIKAEGQAGFIRPYLKSSVEISHKEFRPWCDRINMSTDLTSGKKPGTLVGLVTARALDKGKQILSATGTLTTSSNSLDFSESVLSRQDKRGKAKGRLSVSMVLPEIVYSVQGNFEDIHPSDWGLGGPSLGGTISASGTFNTYKGTLTLKGRSKNSNWQSFDLLSAIQGDSSHIALDGLKAKWLQGTVTGNIRVDWKKDLEVAGEIKARNLNPQIVNTAWIGRINTDATIRGDRVLSKNMQASIDAHLLESTFGNRPLTGIIKAEKTPDDILITRADLKGNGFVFQASGSASKGLAVKGTIARLSILVPESQGTLSGQGLLKYREGKVSLEATAKGDHVAYGGAALRSFEIVGSFNEKDRENADLHFSGQGFNYNGIDLNSIVLNLTGAVSHHTITATLSGPKGDGSARIVAGYDNGSWHGSLENGAGKIGQSQWKLLSSTPFLASKKEIHINPFVVTGIKGEKISGMLNWAESGLSLILDLDMNRRGSCSVKFTSRSAPLMAIPDSGVFSFEWKKVDLRIISPFIPDQISIDGFSTGSARGHIVNDKGLYKSFVLAYDSSLDDAHLGWSQNNEGIGRISFKKATLHGEWKDDSLKGDASFELAEYGKGSSTFSLPIPGRFPLSVIPTGSVNIGISGQFREQGLISAFLAGLVEQTKGRLGVDVTIGGTWNEPSFKGKVALTDAAAYLPVPGMHMKNITGEINMENDTIKLSSFKAESGPGFINVTGVARMKNWNIDHFEGRLTGQRFQAVYLPSLRLLTNPDLTFQGTGKVVSIKGEIGLPQLLIYGPPALDVVKESSDVVIADGPTKKKTELPFDMTASVKVTLGDEVKVKMAGIDAQLGGSAQVLVDRALNVTANGRIDVIKGNYNAFGSKLDITKGQILLAGQPDKANLNILAVRTISSKLTQNATARSTITSSKTSSTSLTSTTLTEEPVNGESRTMPMVAGIQVTGNVQAPIISLYSRPAMSDADILSYMLVGKAATSDGVQTGLLMKAANSLFSRGQSAPTLEQLKKSLGLEDLEVETNQIGTEKAMVSVGKYLGPGLYASFGRSLFNSDYIISIRYSLTKNWEIRTTAGPQSGGDIYYKMEFD